MSEPNRPVLPCPSWCATNHASAAAMSDHIVTRRVGGKTRPGWVGMVLADYGTEFPSLADMNGEVRLTVSSTQADRSVFTSLADAEKLAGQALAFWRPDIARVIRELAQLATETTKAA